MTRPPIPSFPSLNEVIQRKLLFVSGKGGVGKTVVSQAIALLLSRRGGKTLWTTFEDPTWPRGELRQVAPNLWHFNCDAARAFEEYATMKIGVARLARIFVQNKLMRYLAKAAPGIHELVLLGKIWFERQNYDHIVVDMPSTGYGLAMFHSTQNLAKLFTGGPINRDAQAMLETFRDARETGHLIVSLPEEMPLRESLELGQFLLDLFPSNPAAFLANRVFPIEGGKLESANPDDWPNPLASSKRDYLLKRNALEDYNLRLWRDEKVRFSQVEFIPPPVDNSREKVVSEIASRIGSQPA